MKIVPSMTGLLPEADDTDLCELDRLLNDPETPMQAGRVWELLERVSSRAQEIAPR